MLWRLHYVSRLFLCHLLLHSFRCEEQKQQRSDILLALERAALFLEEESQDINVDAILGFAVLQAYLNKTLAKWETKPGLEPDSKRVALLEKKLSAGMEEARSALELENPDSYREWAQVLRPSFWKVPEHFERLDYAVAFTPTNGSCLDLKESDVCLSFLLGSWKDDGEPCLVPRKCSRLMTQTHCSDYALSHQLFNFLFAEMKGCRNPLFLNARFYRNVLCRLMMQENLHPQKNALLNAPGDLFTENRNLGLRNAVKEAPFLGPFPFCLSRESGFQQGGEGNSS
ncbi:UPF0764 protein C16orf89 homolog [Anolis sagrei]|uniref:UPF0764 protein C16orf89 homolog n=1 Tax=Anolis sagrei TaxID=38937 RepID=UPI0035223D4C